MTNLNRKIINSRYRIAEKIAETETGSLYRAYDFARNNAVVAVKILKRDCISNRVEDIIRFRSVLNSVSEFDQESILRVFETGEFFELNYIVSEFLEAKNLSDCFENGAMPVDEAVDILIRITEAMDYCHKKKILHLDLNPGSILITKEGIKITDFGIAHIKAFSELKNSDGMAAALACISPEQSGVIKRTVDERSDLYSVGVIFYNMLTGRLPFAGNDICSIVHQQIAQIPELPENINSLIPHDIGRIIMKLLEKEPENRYQTAGGLLFDLQKFTDGERNFILGLHDRSTKLSFRTKLIGREKEFETILSMIESSIDGSGGVCLINGEAGAGKSRLVEEIREYAGSGDMLCIDGNCFQRDRMNPYVPFKNSLTSYYNKFNSYTDKRKHDISEMIRKRFGNLLEIIITINPLIGDMLGDSAKPESFNPVSGNERFQAIAGRFFTELSDIEGGLIILLEDLHWSDEGSLYLLQEIISGISDHPLLVVGTFRDDELKENNSLKRLIDAVENGNVLCKNIHLDVFNYEEMNRFVSDLLLETGKSNRAITEFILRKSGGNPFFSIEILKQLILDMVLFFDNDKWNADIDALDDVEISPSIVEILLNRIHFFDSMEKEVLTYAALIGREFDITLLDMLSSLDVVEIVRVVDKAIALQLLETDRNVKGKIRFVHERIERAFHGNIDSVNKKRLHLLIARALEEMNQNDIDSVIFTIAQHYIESGDKDKSIEYSFPSGKKAKDHCANEDAIKYFIKTIELLDETDAAYDNLRLECKRELGEIYLTIGEYDKSIEIFNEILFIAHNNINEVYIYKQICDAYYKKGDWNNCEKYAEKGLGLLGEKIPHSYFMVWLGTIKEIIILVMHLLPVWRVISPDKQKRNNLKMIAELYKSLTLSYALNDSVKLLKSNLRMLNIAQRYRGLSKELGLSLTAFGALWMTFPFFGLSSKYLHKGLLLNKKLNNQWGIAKTYQFVGYFYEWQGDYSRSLDYFHRSLDIFEQLGDSKELVMTLNGIEHCYYYTADYPEAKRTNDNYFDIVNKSHDAYGMGAADIYYSQYYRELGDIEKARQYSTRSNDLSYEKDIKFNYCSSFVEMGCNELEAGNTSKAIAYLESARDLYEKNYFCKQYVVLVYSNLAQAYITDYLNNEHEMDHKAQKIYLRKIKKSCISALKKTQKWPTHFGSSLQVAGNYYALIGKRDNAGDYYKESISHLSKTGRKYELARSLYAYGLFLSEGGDTRSAKKNFESAYQVFRAINAELYVSRLSHILGIRTAKDDAETSLLEKFINRERVAAISELSSAVGSIKNPELLLKETVAKAIEITGAKRGCLFLIDEESGGLHLKSSIDIGSTHVREYIMGIAEKACRTGEYIIADNAGDEIEGIDHDVSFSPKSILCTPIRSGSETIGVCYLGNPLSTGVFTEKDAYLLQLFLSQIVASLENAILHEKLNSSVSSGRQNVITPVTEDKIKRAIQYIDIHYTSDISREGLAASLDINPDHLGKSFKSVTGKTISGYINELRIKDAARMLQETDEKIIEIAFAVGFESLSTFNRVFHKITGVAPKKYRSEKNSFL